MRVSHRASEYLALFAAGFTVTEISRRCGVSKSTVSTLLKKAEPRRYKENPLLGHAHIAQAALPAPCVIALLRERR